MPPPWLGRKKSSDLELAACAWAIWVLAHVSRQAEHDPLAAECFLASLQNLYQPHDLSAFSCSQNSAPNPLSAGSMLQMVTCEPGCSKDCAESCKYHAAAGSLQQCQWLPPFVHHATHPESIRKQPSEPQSPPSPWAFQVCMRLVQRAGLRSLIRLQARSRNICKAMRPGDASPSRSQQPTRQDARRTFLQQVRQPAPRGAPCASGCRTGACRTAAMT